MHARTGRISKTVYEIEVGSHVLLLEKIKPLCGIRGGSRRREGEPIQLSTWRSVPLDSALSAKNRLSVDEGGPER
jgi:hypothetical protein